MNHTGVTNESVLAIIKTLRMGTTHVAGTWVTDKVLKELSDGRVKFFK